MKPFLVLSLLSCLIFATSSARADDPVSAKADDAAAHARFDGGMAVTSDRGPGVYTALEFDDAFDVESGVGRPLVFSPLTLIPRLDGSTATDTTRAEMRTDVHGSLISVMHLRWRRLYSSEAAHQEASDLAEELGHIEDYAAREARAGELRAKGYGVNLACNPIESLDADHPRICVTTPRDAARSSVDFTALSIGGTYRRDAELGIRQYGGRVELAATSFDTAIQRGGVNLHLCGAIVPLALMDGKSEGLGKNSSLARLCAGAAGHLGEVRLTVTAGTDWKDEALVGEKLEVKNLGGSGMGLFAEHEYETSELGSTNRGMAGVQMAF